MVHSYQSIDTRWVRFSDQIDERGFYETGSQPIRRHFQKDPVAVARELGILVGVV